MGEKIVEFRPRVHRTEEMPDKVLPDGSDPKDGSPFYLPVSDTEYLCGYVNVIDNQFTVYIETVGNVWEPIVTIAVIENSLCTTTHAVISGVAEPMSIVRHLFTNYNKVKA